MPPKLSSTIGVARRPYTRRSTVEMRSSMLTRGARGRRPAQSSALAGASGSATSSQGAASSSAGGSEAVSPSPPALFTIPSTQASATAYTTAARPSTARPEYVAVKVPASVEKELQRLRERREALEQQMTEEDVRVYELESHYYKLCAEIGGTLFTEGCGLSVHQQRRGTGRGRGRSSSVSSPLLSQAESSDSLGNGGDGSSPTSPLADTVSYSSSRRGASVLALYAASAFHSRSHRINPAERLFSSSSIGAIGRVETYYGETRRPFSPTPSFPAPSLDEVGMQRVLARAAPPQPPPAPPATAAAAVNLEDSLQVGMRRRYRRRTGTDEEAGWAPRRYRTQ